MKQFPMNRGDFDMLPYESRLNEHNPRCPMRLYNIETVRKRACLKYAMLAGLHKNGPNRLSKAEVPELVSRGEELWKAAYVISPYRKTFLYRPPGAHYLTIT